MGQDVKRRLKQKRRRARYKRLKARKPAAPKNKTAVGGTA